MERQPTNKELEKENERLRTELRARRSVEEGVMKVGIFKKLENTEIWEFRTLYNGICYRLFSFWDTEEETLVIATHGIVKKTHKTPLKEITKAEEIRKEYFNNKNK